MNMAKLAQKNLKKTQHMAGFFAVKTN